jgi:hypothetical protein
VFKASLDYTVRPSLKKKKKKTVSREGSPSPRLSLASPEFGPGRTWVEPDRPEAWHKLQGQALGVVAAASSGALGAGTGAVMGLCLGSRICHY